jgi:hypothetical protein
MRANTRSSVWPVSVSYYVAIKTGNTHGNSGLAVVPLLVVYSDSNSETLAAGHVDSGLNMCSLRCTGGERGEHNNNNAL